MSAAKRDNEIIITRKLPKGNAMNDVGGVVVDGDTHLVCLCIATQQRIQHYTYTPKRSLTDGRVEKREN